jgi:toxin FitB
VIAVDTNVVSELLRPQADGAVTDWVNAQPAETLFLTAINAAELWAGVSVLPEGARKRALQTSLDSVLDRLFANRRVPFDDVAARAYADIVRRTQAAGTPVALGDGLIAAVALSRGLAIATRDAAPFRAAGLEVIDPWTYTGPGSP